MVMKVWVVKWSTDGDDTDVQVYSGSEKKVVAKVWEDILQYGRMDEDDESPAPKDLEELTTSPEAESLHYFSIEETEVYAA
jgi:hypothetical protein